MLKPALLIFSYFSGSIPWGLVITYAVKRIDIRKHGSGNIGATNVRRVLGRKWGVLVFILDFLKGFSPIVLARFLFPVLDQQYSFFTIMGLISVCGHNWPVFLNFKGGKGVATTIGVIAGLSVLFPSLWFVLVLTLVSWLVVFLISRYVSLASLAAAFSFVLFSFVFSLPRSFKLLAVVSCVFIVVRHTKNIKNLFNRQEHRF